MRKMIIEIDKKSGFCFGVQNAINKAEELTKNNSEIISLGEIVHNENEIERLGKLGVKPISVLDLSKISEKTVLIRTHGEPPSAYEELKRNNNRIVDATCPVVLKLQQRISKSFSELQKSDGQILIYGKKNHPEVIGLNGQTKDKAIVISNIHDLDKVDYSRPIELYCQTTMPLDGFEAIKSELKNRAEKSLVIYDTICRQVANRVPHLKWFATQYDLVIFVSGSNSSNGKLLFNVCKTKNQNTRFVTSAKAINFEWFDNVSRVGICGATSTPQWLMEDVKQFLENEFNVSK